MNGNNPPSPPPPGQWAGYRPPVMTPLPRTALFLQAIRGPIVLITLGVLFAIHQAHILSFAHTWPLLIIVIGVMKLLERLAIPRNIAPPGGSY